MPDKGAEICVVCRKVGPTRYATYSHIGFHLHNDCVDKVMENYKNYSFAVRTVARKIKMQDTDAQMLKKKEEKDGSKKRK